MVAYDALDILNTSLKAGSKISDAYKAARDHVTKHNSNL